MDETDLLEGLALYLHERGLVTYVPDGTGGDLFMEGMPSTPDVCVVLTCYGGPEPDSLLPYDQPRVQVRVRGTTDPRVSRRRLKAIRSHLLGLGPAILPDGTNVISCNALQAAPESLGADDNRRHEHVCNFEFEIRETTVHRS
ncbi:minor capsid protein [Streptomyces sp. NBC_01565]|uniref:minor capsid protein n=1 Tax=Streptomyces sp. NBC_01565 TaxID=2975881 RepID=UPI0022507350|nr:minor capsid protein [Streptomyces sp. NBC_01565]MCX4540499.1 minor capsid protein [Streptomyces sp. NBC_01565]